MQIDKRILWRLFSLVSFLEAMIALYFLAAIPSDSKNSVLLGFSLSRLILMSGVLGFMLLTALMFFVSHAQILKIDAFFSKLPMLQTSLLGVGVGMGILFLCTPADRMGEALYMRFLPLVALGMLVALQALLLQFTWMNKRLNWTYFLENRQVLRIFAIILAFFVFLWILIAWTGIGIEREPTGWLSPGTPLLPQQMALAAVIGIVFFTLGTYFDRYQQSDLLIACMIWILAALLWWQQPMLHASYFSPKPTPPNFEYYPYSDAALYDTFSQNFLIGASRDFGLTHRPLYALFLALLHFLTGPGLQNVLWMQVLVLAISPAVAYLLVSRLGNRPAGIMVALLLVLREKNSIALSNIIEVSHVKLIMSDVPTMLTMILFVYFYIKWFQGRKSGFTTGVLAGASLGLSILIRSQAQLLIPIALLGIFLIEKFNWRISLRKSAVFLLSILVVVLPWVWRNYQVSGRVVVEYSEGYTRFIASAYTSSPEDIKQLPDETDDHYVDRMRQQILVYIKEHPLEVARSCMSYFLHNEITSLTYLPMSLRFDTLNEYVARVGFWDYPYLGEIPRWNLPIFAFIVAMIAFGIAVVWKRFQWLGIMPLFFHLGYSISSAPVRQSGWRFILPGDWIILIYFCVGLIQFGLLLYSLFSTHTQRQTFISVDEESKLLAWKRAGALLAFFALISTLIPVIEWSIPQRYPSITEEKLIQSQWTATVLLENGEKVSASDLQSFLQHESDAVVIYGRALYPSYYEKSKYWGEDSANLLEASKYNRLQFNLIGSENIFVFIPLQAAPDYFPHASDTLVIGCLNKTRVQALIVKVNDHVLAESPWQGLSCSIME